jgi:capsular polysaccharide biosynthesis protein
LTTSRRLRSTARTWFWFILGGTLLGAVIAFGLGTVAPPGYASSVTLLVSPIPKSTGITNGDLQVAQGLTPTFAELATTRPILDRVIRRTGASVDIDALARSVTTRVPVGTSLLTISVLDQDAQQAASLANAIGSELRSYAQPTGLDPTQGLQVELTVVDPATPPTERDGPGLPVRVILGAAIALFLTSTIAFLVENVWPQTRVGIAPPAPVMAPPPQPPYQARPAAERPWKPAANDVSGAEQSTIGQDPLRSTSAVPAGRIASRGIVNDLEVEKTRRPD